MPQHEKYLQKYRIESNRLQQWDYKNAGAYFITICTKQRSCFLGSIVNQEMILSPLGKIAQDEWFATPIIRPDMNITLDSFVVMPNHIHGIICIGDNEYNKSHTLYVGRDAMHRVSTFGPQSKNLASIMRGYKSSVTKKSRLLTNEFEWQANYFEHIIKNERSYSNIKNYIETNILNWKDDRYY